MKKMLSKILVLFAMFCLTSGNVFAKEYTDMTPDHWAYNAIQTLTDFGVVVGYPDGAYRPDADVTRAEFATMVVKALDQQNAKLTQTADFSDVKSTDWYYDMVQRAVMFDLIKGHADGTFAPYDPVTRAQAIAVVVNALTTEDISRQKALEILENAYSDWNTLPEWLVIPAGKAEILGMIVTRPGYEGKIDPYRYATRAEVSVFLCNMIEQAKLNPNDKLRAVMQPRTADGIVIDGVDVQGYVATLPAGTIIPVVVLNGQLAKKRSEINKEFLSKIPKNLISSERYLLFLENSPVTGKVQDVQFGRLFVKNGKTTLQTCTITTPKNAAAQFPGVVIDEGYISGFWKNLFRKIFKGGMPTYHTGQVVKVQLLKPIRIDLTNGWIME